MLLSRWRGAVAVCQVLLIAVPMACRTEGYLERRIAAIGGPCPLDGWVAKKELVSAGPRAVPATVRALQREDAQPDSAFWLIYALREIGDPRAVPALVRIADQVGKVEANQATLAYTRAWPYIALQAREALGYIVDPAGARELRNGRPLSAFPVDPGTAVYDSLLAARMEYYKKVNEWYDAWRGTYRADQWPGADLLTSGPDPVEGTVSRSIEAIRLWPQVHNGAEALVRTGRRSVPAVVALLEQKERGPALQLLAVELLEKIGDRRCVPALVRIADALEIELEHPAGAVTGENFGTVVLRARRAIGIIVEPANRGKFGAWETSDAPPGTAEFNKAVRVQLAYYERVNAWYAQWRKTYVPESYAGR